MSPTKYFSPLWLLIVLAALSLGFSPSLRAGPVHVPCGFLRWTLPATGSADSNTFVGISLLPPSTYAGVVDTAFTNGLTVNDQPWQPGAFVTSPGYIFFLSGKQAGRMVKVLSNTANSATVDLTDTGLQTVALDEPGFAVTAGDRFEIVPARTLANTFGASAAQLQLPGGATIQTADVVSFYNYANLQWVEYFFNTSQSRWEISGGGGDAGGTLLPMEGAVRIVRRANRPETTLTITGVAPSVAFRTKVVSNQAKYTTTRVPVPVTFAQLDFGSDWVRGTSVFKSDTLSLWNEAGQKWDTYFRLPAGDWRKSGDNVTDQSNVTIPAGAVVGILKRTTPTTTARFLSAPLPYSLLPAAGGDATTPAISPSSPDSYALSWTTVNQATYQLETSPDLNSWTALGSQIVGTGNPLTVADTPASPGRAFYRLLRLRSLNAEVREQIDNRLVGNDPLQSLTLWNNRSDPGFTLNPLRWTGSIDVTCIPGRPINFYGALISPRHVLTAAHASPGIGATYTFVTADGTKVDRVLTGKIISPNYSTNFSATTDPRSDWCVGILDSDVPREITPARLLPDNFGSKLTSLSGTPAIGLNQFGELTVREISYLGDTFVHQKAIVAFQMSSTTPRQNFYRTIISGDSGSPIFLVVSGQPVFTSLWTAPTFGPFFIPHKTAINAAMHTLSVSAGATTDYQLSEVDLREFF